MSLDIFFSPHNHNWESVWSEGFDNGPVRCEFSNKIPQIANCRSLLPWELRVTELSGEPAAAALPPHVLMGRTVCFKPQALAFNLPFTSPKQKSHQS